MCNIHHCLESNINPSRNLTCEASEIMCCKYFSLSLPYQSLMIDMWRGRRSRRVRHHSVTKLVSITHYLNYKYKIREDAFKRCIYRIKIAFFLCCASFNIQEIFKIWESNQRLQLAKHFLFVISAFQWSMIEKIMGDILVVVLTCILTVKPDQTASPNGPFYETSHRSTPCVYHPADFPCLNWRTSKWSSNRRRWVSSLRFAFLHAIHDA